MLPYEIIVNIGVPERFFYRIRNSMCSFRWNYFQLEIRCLVLSFFSNHYSWYLIRVRFDWYSRFLNRKTSNWPQTNIIFGISTKNWVDQCVFGIVSKTFFFGQIFTPGTPQGYVKKWTYSKNHLYNRKRVKNLSNVILLQNYSSINNKIVVLIRFIFSHIPGGYQG